MTDISKLTENERKAIEARREYYRQWRAANKDKVKRNNQRYWEKVAAKQNGGEHA